MHKYLSTRVVTLRCFFCVCFDDFQRDFYSECAVSDAVGCSMADYLREYMESYYTDEEYKKREIYIHAEPFTKEFPFYRELFEKISRRRK